MKKKKVDEILEKHIEEYHNHPGCGATIFVFVFFVFLSIPLMLYVFDFWIERFVEYGWFGF